MGETPHERVNEGTAAARGPGTATTAETTDGVSLATPASGPRELVKLLLPPPLLKSTILPPKQTPPHANESHGKGQQVAVDDNEVHRAHECVNDPANGTDTSMDKTAARATASASTDAAAPHNMPNATLKGERRGRETTSDTGALDQAEATQDPGHHEMTGVSAQSASHDHPDEDAGATDPPRPSEDPADATGDDECHPDAPTEPPDLPEGARG